MMTNKKKTATKFRRHSAAYGEAAGLWAAGGGTSFWPFAVLGAASSGGDATAGGDSAIEECSLEKMSSDGGTLGLSPT